MPEYPDNTKDDYPEPPTTNNHAIPVPIPIGEEGAEDYEDVWGHILNDMGWFYLEEVLIARDEQAALGEYTPYEDSIFWATDSGQPIYRGDGDSWELADMHVDGLEADTIHASHKSTVNTVLNGNDTLTISGNESMVVAHNFSIDDSAELTIEDSGVFQVS